MRPKPSRVSAFRNCLGTIWSVSTLTRSSGITLPLCVENGCIVALLLDWGDVEVADVDEVTGDGGGCGHQRADQVRAAVFALAALEIAVGGAGAALVRRQHVGVHADAHAAAGIAPLETGGGEYLVQALFLGLRLDAARAGDDQRLLDAAGDMFADDELRGGTEIVDAGIGAGADEDAIDGNVHDGRAGFEAHVDQRALRRFLIIEIAEG